MPRCAPAWICRSPARAACARPAAPSWSRARRQMEVNYSLEPWELKAGFILTCQARPMLGEGRGRLRSRVIVDVRGASNELESDSSAAHRRLTPRTSTRSSCRQQARRQGDDVNVKATLSPDDLARACADAMWKEDDASRARHGDRRDRAGPRDADDDGAAGHGQRPAHRPWRLHLHARRFRLRLCLQHATTNAWSRRRATSPSSGRASSATGWSPPRAKSRAADAPASTTCGSPSDDTVIAEFRGHSRAIGGTWLPVADSDTKQEIDTLRKRAMASTNLKSEGSGYRAETG